MLGVKCRIGTEREFGRNRFLEFDQQLLVFLPEAFEHGRVDDDAELEVRFVALPRLRISPSLRWISRSW